MVYQFLKAATTNYQELGGLQHTNVSSYCSVGQTSSKVSMMALKIEEKGITSKENGQPLEAENRLKQILCFHRAFSVEAALPISWF